MTLRRTRTRREALWLAGGLGAALATARCGGSGSPPGVLQSLEETVESATEAAATATAQPSPTPTPVPAGREERRLMAGTPWATPVHIANSGVSGPVLLVLGGVHGNEPGGWGAAEGIATWEPVRGRLLTIPHANVEAIALFARTTDELGDLNRLYPGSPESEFPMGRMAAEIVALAKQESVEVALDLHESWQFFVDAPNTGTASLGQTMTMGIGPRNPDFGRAALARANVLIAAERDLMIERDGSRFRRSDGSSINGDAPGNRGRSSLSLGGHVPGLTPILVEMGQQDQSLERRIQLHHIVTRAAMDELEM
jgi:hypothetical protein